MTSTKININNQSTPDKFVLAISYTPKKDEKLDFNFSNSLGLIEMDLLKILDGETTLHPDAIKFISPRETKQEQAIISKKQPFVYHIEGRLIEEGALVRLKLRTVEYLLEKGKEYTLILERSHDKSNQVAFVV